MISSKTVAMVSCWCLALATTLLAEDPKCPHGYQPYANRCISQRMADYISCVEASGANQQRVSTEVSNAQSGQFTAGAKGSGSGIVAKGSGSLVIDRNAEQALAKKFENTWFSNAMAECRSVLTPERQVSTPAAKSNSKGPPAQNLVKSQMEIADKSAIWLGVWRAHRHRDLDLSKFTEDWTVMINKSDGIAPFTGSVSYNYVDDLGFDVNAPISRPRKIIKSCNLNYRCRFTYDTSRSDRLDYKADLESSSGDCNRSVNNSIEGTISKASSTEFDLRDQSLNAPPTFSKSQ